MRVPRWALYAAAAVPIAALFALLIWAVTRDASGPGGLSTNNTSGEAAVVQTSPPGFTLPLYDGGTISLSDLRGKVVMLDFWASWCVPCRVEAPEVERTWQRYKDRGVVFIGIDTWDKEQDARDFIAQFQPTYPVGPDPRGSIAIDYGVTGIPEKYFIGRDGRIVRKLIGPMTVDRLSAVLDQLLAAPAA
jgi:cytochrome c biogenesis protein CcmG/thiol:disulfide interchange protein DsbE